MRWFTFLTLLAGLTALLSSYLGYMDGLRAAAVAAAALASNTLAAFSTPLALLALAASISCIYPSSVACIAGGILGLAIALLSAKNSRRLLVASSWLAAPLVAYTAYTALLIGLLQAVGLRGSRTHSYLLVAAIIVTPLLPAIGLPNALPAYIVTASIWSLGAYLSLLIGGGCPVKTDTVATRYSMIASIAAPAASIASPSLSLILAAGAYTILLSSILSPVVETVVRGEAIAEGIG